MFKDRDEALREMEQALLEEELLDEELLEEELEEEQDFGEAFYGEFDEDEFDEDEFAEDEEYEAPYRPLPLDATRVHKPFRAYNSDVSDEDLESYSDRVAQGVSRRGCLLGPLLAVLLLGLALAGAIWFAFRGWEVWL